MSKPIIGIISPRNEETDRPFMNYTKFINTYPNKILKAGGIPICLVFPDGKFQIEEMELCDGFVFQGGPKIESYQINAVKYAVDNKKPILGICLGMQTMAGFNWVKSELGDMVTYSEIEEFFKPEYEEYFLEKINGHDEINPYYLSKIEKSKHEVILEKESILYKLFGEKIDVPSIHRYAVKNNSLDKSKLFKIVGKCSDGTIEAIEGTDPTHFMVGVQYHPELEEDNTPLFRKLIEESKKRKK